MGWKNIFAKYIIKLQIRIIPLLKMESFIAMNSEAEETILFLQQQLAILSSIAEKRCKQNEKEEILRLKNENENLKVNVHSLKEKLAYWEAINGVPQIKLPQITLKSKESNFEQEIILKESESPKKLEDKQPPKGKKEKQGGKGNQNKPAKQQDV